MSIQTGKSKNEDDCSIRLSKLDTLIANLNSSFSFHNDSSFELSREVVTDLYDKENVFQRRFNYFKFPEYVKYIFTFKASFIKILELQAEILLMSYFPLELKKSNILKLKEGGKPEKKIEFLNFLK